MYKQMYLLLFNAITDALKLLEMGNVWDVKKILLHAQSKTEEIYISWNGDEDDNDDL